MNKVGRNSECWCGSGKKYKRCHLGRDKQTPFSKMEAHSLLGLFSNVSKCSVPEDLKYQCQTRIVKAHTLSKGNSLKSIALNGHVLGLKHGLSTLEKNNGKLAFERIGINQASTFTGFCSYHDKELFSCVEDECFKITKKQCTMLAYRPLMREVYVKEANYKVMQKTRDFDKGLSFSQQLAITKIAIDNINGAKLSVSDLTYIKSRIDKSIKDQSFDALKHLILELVEVPKVMACGVHGPIVDIFGNDLQEISFSEDTRPAYVVVNLLALDGIGYMILSWLPEDDEVIMRFVDSIKKCSLNELGDRLTNYIFTFFENIFASEVWWEALGDKKEFIIEHMMQGVESPHLYNVSLIERDKNRYNAINVGRFLELY